MKKLLKFIIFLFLIYIVIKAFNSINDSALKNAQELKNQNIKTIQDSNQIRKIEPQLILLDWHWGEEVGFAIAEGQVKNVSSEPLHHIEAVIIFLTSNGELITSDSALLQYDPIMPGQISPFKVTATYNPLMTKASINFKFLIGPSIQWSEPNQQ
jgi:hypothetical protein